jgi:hypothetical protein
VRLISSDLRAGDVGRHQVGRELDALEAEVENLRQRPDQQRLGEPRHAGDQTVPSREQGDEHEVHRLFLTDDDLLQLFADAAPSFDDTGDDVLGGIEGDG